jgi:hypothetical protein
MRHLYLFAILAIGCGSSSGASDDTNEATGGSGSGGTGGEDVACFQDCSAGGSATGGIDAGGAATGGTSSGGQSTGGDASTGGKSSGGTGGAAPECTKPAVCFEAGFEGTKPCEGGTWGECELLLAHIVLPEATDSGNLGVQPSSADLWVISWEEGGYGTLFQESWSNGATDKHSGTFSGVADLFDDPTATYGYYFSLNGSHLSESVSEAIDLTGVNVTRWEAKPFANTWSGSPSDIEWTRGMDLKFFGTVKN